MTSREHKIVQYLNEAHAMEQGLTRVLQAQIAAAPRSDFRYGLERHLTETREHAERISARASELGDGTNPVEFGIGLLEDVIGQALAIAKAPIDLIRGRSGDEKVLKDAKDACATESLEIATYTAMERLAESVGDTRTAELARSICTDEQRMLDRLLGELPQLAMRVADAELRGEPSFEISETGAADAARDAGRSAKRKAGKAKRRASRAGASAARSTARKASAGTRRASASTSKASARNGSTRKTSTRKGTGTSARSSSARSSSARSSSARKASTGAPARRKPASRRGAASSPTGSSSRRGAAQGSGSRPRTDAAAAGSGAREPWPGYDEQTVREVRATLDDASVQRAERVSSYEQVHKDRSGVVEKAEHEVAQS